MPPPTGSSSSPPSPPPIPPVPPPTLSTSLPTPTPLSAALYRLYTAEEAYTLTTHLISYLRAQIYYMHHSKLDLQYRYWHSAHDPQRQSELLVGIEAWRILLMEARRVLKEARETRFRQWVLVERARARVWTLLMRKWVLSAAGMYLTLMSFRRGG